MANSTSRVIKEGFLIKSPPQEKIMAAWHRRFFVLWQTGLMEYYSSSDKKPQDYLKTIDLRNCEDMVAPFPTSGRVYVIKVAILTNGRLRDYFFDCSNETVLNEWVDSLADVCGFAAVDGEQVLENYAEITSPPPLPSGVKPSFTDKIPTPPILNKPKLRPPLPPPKPSSPSLDINSVESYEDIDFSSSVDEVHYSEAGSSAFIEEDIYDIGINDDMLYTLNKRPPPVWRPPTENPPPLPNRPKKYVKSRQFLETLDGASFSLASDVPPPLPPGRPDSNKNQLANRLLPTLPQKSPSSSDKKTKPLPMTPKKNSRGKSPSSSSSGVSMGSDFKNDLERKLGQTKQQVASESSRDDEVSYPNSTYEELTCDSEDSDTFSPEPNQRRPNKMVCISASENEDGYIDVDPSGADIPEDYLDFQTANHRASQFLSENEDFFPPKTESYHSKPITSNVPPIPLPPRSKIPNQGSSSRTQGTAVQVVPSKSSRKTDIQNDSVSLEHEDEMAPPVPRRHPHASDKNKKHAQPVSGPGDKAKAPPNNPLPLPPRSMSPMSPLSQDEDDAPPIPDRGKMITLDPAPPTGRSSFDAVTKSLHSQQNTSLPTEPPQPLLKPKSKFKPQFQFDDENIFEDVVFGKEKSPPFKKDSSDSQPPWRSPSPPSRAGSSQFNSGNSSLTLDSRTSIRHDRAPPSSLPKPTITQNETNRRQAHLGGTSKPLAALPPKVSIKPKEKSPPFVPYKREAYSEEISPPPISTKPLPWDGPATRKKPPIIPDSNEPTTSRKPLVINGPTISKKPPSIPVNSGPAVSKKPPGISANNGPAVSKKPPSIPVNNGPAVSKKPSLIPANRGPATSKKPLVTPINNGPATASTAHGQTIPTAPPTKVKSVMKHLNHDFAACLQNVHRSSRESSPTEPVFQLNQKPLVPIKNKPLLPSKR